MLYSSAIEKSYPALRENSMRLIIVSFYITCLIAVAPVANAQSPFPVVDADAAETQAALALAEREVAALRLAAADVSRSMSMSRSRRIAIPEPILVNLFGSQNKGVFDQCRSEVRSDVLLTPAGFARAPSAIIEYQACMAAEGGSLAPCDALSSFSLPAQANESRPKESCRASVGLRVLTRQLIEPSRVKDDSFAPKFYWNYDASRRDAVDKAIRSGGGAEAACSKVAQVLGPSFRASGKAQCVALLGLKGATSKQACEVPTLPETSANACRGIFRTTGAQACGREFLNISAQHCLPRILERLVRMGPDYVGVARNADPRATAMEIFKLKREEVDDLLVRIGAWLRSTPFRNPAYKSIDARYQRVRAAEIEILKNLKGSHGR